MEPLTLDTRILHLAPIARETPSHLAGDSRFVGLTPQGLVRHWELGEDVPLVQLDAGSLLGDVPLSGRENTAPAGDISPVDSGPEMLPSASMRPLSPRTSVGAATRCSPSLAAVERMSR